MTSDMEPIRTEKQWIFSSQYETSDINETDGWISLDWDAVLGR